MGALAERGVLLRDVRAVPREEAFLIDDILASTITMLSGDPKVGKSLLVAGMLRALLEGDAEFVGLPVYQPIGRVAYGWTDPGADAELKARMPHELNDRVTVFEAHNADEKFWLELADDLRPAATSGQKFDLLVVDNVLGSLAEGDDISETQTATDYMRRVGLVASSGVPTLLVSHTPKGPGDGYAVASSPIGGRPFSAGVRAVTVLRKRNSDGLRLQIRSNRGDDREIPLNVGREHPAAEVPVWTICEARDNGEAKRKRGAERMDEARRVAEMVIADQPPRNMSEIARQYNDRTWLGFEAIRAGLVKSLIEWRDGQWTWRDPT